MDSIDDSDVFEFILPFGSLPGHGEKVRVSGADVKRAFYGTEVESDLLAERTNGELTEKRQPDG